MVEKGGSKMPKFKPYRKNQVMLFPESIDDYVSENHLSRTIDGIVEKLLSGMVFLKVSAMLMNMVLY